MDSEIIIVLSVLVITAVLLIIDKLRIDVVALLCLLALTWSGVLQPLEALAGFSSNAVITMIAVMILGRGIARTGVMSELSRRVIKVTGRGERRIILVISSVVSLISGFVQNIGSAVLFLPAILNVSRRQRIPVSRLLMPIGFAIIVGGPLTMIGSGPMILVNDFLMNSSLEPYAFFAVTPVGLGLMATCLLFFFLFGTYLLPRYGSGDENDRLQMKLVEEWNLASYIRHFRIDSGSVLIGKTIEETGIWSELNLHVLAVAKGNNLEYAPWRETKFESGQIIALLGNEETVREFASRHKLAPAPKNRSLELLDDTTSAGFAEIIVPPRSGIIGQSIKKFGLRRQYGVEPVLLYSGGQRVSGDFSDAVIHQGDMFIVHGMWNKIADLAKGYDFLVVTPVESGGTDKSKAWIALACFILSIGLALAGFSVPIAFLTGAVIMVLTGVMRIDEAYRAVDWKVVFFVAGLIPLGLAMQKTGTAAFLAENVVSLVQGSHTFIVLLVISAITTLLSVFMSNVGAAVILFPMAISIATITGMDPRPLALMVAVSTANSFMLPTHQVNALYKTPGGYTNKDYLKAGTGLTVLSLLVITSIFYLFYL